MCWRIALSGLDRASTVGSNTKMKGRGCYVKWELGKETWRHWLDLHMERTLGEHEACGFKFETRGCGL